MKTNKPLVLFKVVKLTLFSLFFISIMFESSAQDKPKRTFLKLFYTKNNNGSKKLVAKISYKENKKFAAVQEGAISFYTGTDLDELIKKVNINSGGEAIVLVPESIEADSLGFFHFAAKFKANKKFKRAKKDLSVKDSRLELSFNQKSEGRTITIKGFEIKKDMDDSPLNEEVYIFVPTLFGDMEINRAVFKDGVCQIEFPDDLPGDSTGNIEIIAKVIDSEVYGNVIKTEIIPWGIPKQTNHIEKIGAKGKLWTHNAPLWMVVTLLILLVGVWSHFGFIIFKMYKINKEGSEKPI